MAIWHEVLIHFLSTLISTTLVDLNISTLFSDQVLSKTHPCDTLNFLLMLNQLLKTTLHQANKKSKRPNIEGENVKILLYFFIYSLFAVFKLVNIKNRDSKGCLYHHFWILVLFLQCLLNLSTFCSDFFVRSQNINLVSLIAIQQA